MAGQFFVGDYKPKSMGEMFAEAANSNLAETSAADAARTYEKKRKLDELFAKHTDAAGNLSPAFLKDATAAGLGRAEIEQYAQYQGGQKAQGVTDAQNNMMLRALGYEPQAQGRNEAQYGAPEPVKIASQSLATPEAGAGAPLGPSSIDPDKLRSPSEVGGVPATASSGRGASPAPVDGAQDGQSMDKWWEWLNSGDKTKEANAKDALEKAHASGWKSWGEPAQNEVLIQGRAPSDSNAGRMAPDTVGPDVFAPVEDNRSWNQRLEDSYNPAKDPSTQVWQAGSGMQPSEDLFKWEPTNEGNQFRQFSTALAAKLNSAGIKDPSEYLHRVYQANFAANMPPQPNAMLRTQGAEGIAKYQQQVMDFNAGIQKAQGAAQKALMDARDKLDTIAKEYGANVYATEEHEANFAGRRKGVAAGEIVRTRPVSETEKTQGEIIANAYQDLRSAEKRGGFEGDYAAAMSRAKADGNVNEDAIVGHLVAMGAWPSDKAVALKNLMRASSSGLAGDVYKMAKLKIGDLYAHDVKKRSAWYQDSRDNMRSAMQLKGYDVREAPQKGGGTKASHEIGEIKVFPNGRKAKWDGKGWAAI